jgi:hypothetical protein
LFYWLLVYIGAPLLALIFYVQHERGGSNWRVTEPVAPLIRIIAVVIGSLLVLLGLIVLAWPEMVIAHWPWPTTPLMTRIFASWFSAFGVGLIWFHFEREWKRIQHVANLMMAAAMVDLLMVFIQRNDLTDTGLNLWVYCFHLALFGLLGGFMQWWQHRATTPVNLAPERAG